MKDNINHPEHYTQGKVECIDAIEAVTSSMKDGCYAWYTGQVIKYMWRWTKKNGLEDLEKAQFYLNRLIFTYKERKKNERGKMTNKLRYEVLERDNFKCKCCGRGREDGVKLHVDHIIPLIQGGRTEESNLQTLCHECNFGKGVK